jgi:hypothetical protein
MIRTPITYRDGTPFSHGGLHGTPFWSGGPDPHLFADDPIPEAHALKAHRIADFVFPNNTDWHVIPQPVLVAAESPRGAEFTDATGETVRFLTAGLWFVSGCIRPAFIGGGNPTIVSATRIVVSTDAGATWVEKRCLQSVFARGFNVNEVDTQRYSGTVLAGVGDLMRLQARTSDVGLILRGWAGFDNPVSASLETHLMGVG